MQFTDLVLSIRHLDTSLRKGVSSVANCTLTVRNWVVGAWILEFEQDGADRAAYGERLVPDLAENLALPGLGASSLWACRQFFAQYPGILQTLSGESLAGTPQLLPILQTLSGESSQAPIVSLTRLRHLVADRVAADGSTRPGYALPPERLLQSLSFSHFVELMKLDDPLKRVFYEIEAVRGAWTVRALKRQIGSLLFERTGLSTDKEKLTRLAHESAETLRPVDIIRDPYVFEFLGLTPAEALREKDLESALIDHLQAFLLELGHGFCFEARQKKIRIGSTDYFIDLVFYHRRLKCHVLIDLKAEPFTHANAGQINTYLSYYRKHEMSEGDRPPVGLLLCTDKDHALAEYALGDMDERLFISTYRLELPDKSQLEAFLQAEAKRLGF